jgi:hypothetical protein
MLSSLDTLLLEFKGSSISIIHWKTSLSASNSSKCLKLSRSHVFILPEVMSFVILPSISEVTCMHLNIQYNVYEKRLVVKSI